MNVIAKLLSNRACHGGPDVRPPGWKPQAEQPIGILPPFPSDIFAEPRDDGAEYVGDASATTGTMSENHGSHLATD